MFRWAGTIWPLVLPYCILNICLLSSLAALKHYTAVRLSILPQGHALMSLLIAYLGVNKVNLAYERYMGAQRDSGHAFMILRELNQLSITLTERYDNAEANEWRDDTKRAIVQLIHETVATLRNERHAAALARNVGYRSGVGIEGSLSGQQPSSPKARVDAAGKDDPMILVQALRSHLYHNSDAVCNIGDGGLGVDGLSLFERVKLV